MDDEVSNMDNNLWKEETISSQKVFDGKVISVQVDTVSLRDGTTRNREIVKYPGAAAIIALVDGKMVMVEQYRKALEKFQLEIPAGKLEDSEKPEIAAIRELQEETGYIAQKLTLLEKFYTSPGFTNASLYVYFTDEVKMGEMNLDDDEDINVKLVTLDEAEAYISSGFISDAKTIFAVYVWKLYLLTGKLK